MKNIVLSALTLWTGVSIALAQNEWPVLKHYDQEHLARIAMPLGGIGTGTVSLNGRGGLQDWEIMNRPAKGYNPSVEQGRAPFFAICVEREGKSTTRLLEGPVQLSDYEGSQGSTLPNHGLPRFASAHFAAAYPFGQAYLADPGLPVEVTVKGFNPLIPGNVDDSSIPMAVLTYRVKNTSSQPLKVSICGSLLNFIGQDGKQGKAMRNKNQYREQGTTKGIFMHSQGVDSTSEQWGTMALVSLHEANISYRTSWIPYQWGSSSLDFWDDFSKDGMLENRPDNENDMPMGSLAVQAEVNPNESRDFRFLITWHFPNRMAWVTPPDSNRLVGNYYTTKYEDAWDVVKKEVPRLSSLEKQTLTFVNAFMESKLPPEVKEAALFNLANLRTQLAFRIRDGHFFGWEGNFDHEGACFGSCTHVWNYEQTTAFLFGELAKSMRDVEFNYATNEQGLMSFRVHLPLDSAQQWGKAAADGQMGSIMKFYRDWQLSGDDQMLQNMWPKVKAAMAFAWIQGGWDENQDGVMEGAQHNTMDVEYYGPNPQMGFWYLGALKACEEMATYMKEKDFAAKCRKLYENGSQWIDANLFNGAYYEQKIIPPMSEDNVAASLLVGMGAKDLSDPDYQLGKGCLVDQLIGQLMAHICGLGYLADEQHIKATLQAIMKYNYRENLEDHVNFMRSFALNDEAALLMASYPGERPANPFPYFTEVMTGFEYTAAIGMLYEGQTTNGLKCIRSIRNRYDGKKRSPFNEAEYGYHYARAMIAWAGVLAMTGFHYSAVTQSMSFDAASGKYFWSNGYAFGTVEIDESKGNPVVRLAIIEGNLSLKTFEMKGAGSTSFKRALHINQGETIDIKIKR